MQPTQTLVLLFAFLITFASAAPVPDFKDIERRWSAGETEVRHTHQHHHHRVPRHEAPVPQQSQTSQIQVTADVDRVRGRKDQSKPCLSFLPGCYIAAWIRRLDSIHNHASIREATPAWPVARTPDSFFTATPDERTQRRSVAEHGGNTALGARLRAIATKILRENGETGLIGKRSRREEHGEAPVLTPRRTMRYRFIA